MITPNCDVLQLTPAAVVDMILSKLEMDEKKNEQDNKSFPKAELRNKETKELKYVIELEKNEKEEN